MKNLRTGTAKFDTIRAKDASGLHIQDDAGNGMFIKDGGNVGIGTATPDRLLHVSGGSGSVLAGKFETASTSGSMIVFKDADTTTNDLQVRIGSDANDLVQYAGGSERMRIDSSGRVGIGTTNPLAKFHIRTKGDTFNDGLIVKTNTGGQRSVRMWVDGSTQKAHIGAGQGTEDLILNHAGGYVGIGTTNPVSKLTISETGNAVNIDPEGSSATSYIGFRANVSAFVGYDYDNASAVLQSGAGKSLRLNTGNETFGSGTALTIDPNGNVGIGTTSPASNHKLHIKHTETANFRIERNKVGHTNSQNGYFQITAAEGSNLIYSKDLDGNAKNFVIDGGNVGIGTTSPSAKTVIKSGVNSLPNSDISADTGTALRILGADEAAIDLGSTGRINNGGVGQWIQARHSEIDSTYYNLLLNPNGGNVGIGTTNPARILHLKDSDSAIVFDTPIDANGSAFSQIKSRRDGNSGYSSMLEFATTESTTAVPNFGGNGSGGSGFNTRMVIDSSGNVGIGTTSPTETLDVRGSVKIGKSGTSPYLTFDEEPDSSAGSEFYLTHDILGNILKFTDDNSNNFIAMDRDTGNVGIGTTNPGVRLQLANTEERGDYASTYGRFETPDFFVRNTQTGSSIGSTKILIQNIGTSGTAEAAVSVVNELNAAGALAFSLRNPSDNTNIVERMRIASNGNVGIGTTSPGSYKLNVNGTARVVHSVNGSQEVTSDDRVKHNEQPIVDALETLSKITPKKYIKTTEMYDANHDFELDADGNPIDENGEPVEHRIEAGVIAQQVLTVDELAFTVSPEDVDEDGVVTSPHGLDYNSLFTYAIAAIQEQQEIIETQNSRIDELISRIETLEQ